MGIYKALLLAGCAGTVALASPAVAQTVDCNVTPDDASCAGEEEGKIVVTGSRIQRQDFNSTTPMVTADEALLVIAYHPDSDFGPTHERHPMINRTIVPKRAEVQP